MPAKGLLASTTNKSTVPLNTSSTTEPSTINGDKIIVKDENNIDSEDLITNFYKKQGVQ